MLQQRLTRNLYTGQTEPLTAPLSFDFTEDLGNKRNLSLLSQYGGAAAAYSLRALGSYNENVVRVRRASDNDEKDFTALQVSSGELTNWVNSQTVPPLDIGVETSEGRIPVPEGGTSIGTPAAAYSLRNLSTTYTGNVVDVRRSSDNTVASFTASQISNGQMLDFVGGDNTIIQSEDFTSGSWNKSSGRVVITSNSITAPDGELTADLATWSTPNNADSLRQDKSFLAQQYTVSIYLKYNSAQWVQMYFGSTGFTGGHANFDLINGVIGGNKVGSSSIEDVGDGWYRCSVTRTASTSGNTAICATVPVSSGLASRFGAEVAGAYYVWGGQMNEGSIKAYTMTTTGVSGNGFVSKWYDQSGNDNHATQGTAASQPKIVSAGVFLGEVDFDGVDDSLETTNSALCNVDELSVFSVLKPDIAPTSIAVAFSCGSVVANSSAYGGWRLNFNGYLDKAEFQTQAIGSSSTSTVSNDVGGSYTLISYVADFPDASTFANGQAGLTSTNTISPNNNDASRRRFRIGCQFTFNRSGFYPQPIKEIIIYTSDQSANRTAIEANIGETYGITGIPAYDNTVDGFVETWYDQSGNGNDATQSVAGSQPKIVDAGVLVSGNTGEPAFTGDGVDDILSLSSSINFGTGEFFVSTVVDVDTGGVVIGSASPNWMLLVTTSSIQVRASNTNVIYIISPDSVLTAGESYLISLSRVENDITAYVNGVAQADVETVVSTDTFSADRFLQRGTNGNPYPDPVSEVIIYASDQSANRVAIETNINDHYNIY
jgi:hypothetical protein